MEKLNHYLSRGIHFSILFIAVTFPLPYKVANLGIVALALFWIIQKVTIERKPSYKFDSKSEKWIFFSCIGFFLLQIVSLAYTSDFNNGVKNIESKLSFLIFPLILFDLRPSFRECLVWLKAFVYSMAVCTIVLLTQSISHYFSEGTLLTYHDFTSSLAFHAVFYSYYIFLSVIISARFIQNKLLVSYEKVLFVIGLLLSFMGLLISASKNVLIVTSLFLVVGVFIRLLKHKIGWKEVLVVFLIGAASVYGISKVPAVKSRIVELTQLNGMENLEKVKRGEFIVEEDIWQFNGTSLRITLWYVAWKKILKDDVLWLGYSPGDRRAEMNEEFYEIGLNPWYKNYNIHNQFIQVLAELGLLGLSLYLILHVSLFVASLKQRNVLLGAFLIGFTIFQLTESVIERNKGDCIFCILFTVTSTNETSN